MKRQIIFLLTAGLALFTVLNLDAIGGRGGGGARGGGVSRGGGGYSGGGGGNRGAGRASDFSRSQSIRPQQNLRANYPSPSMTRADGRANMPRQDLNRGSTPSASQVQQFMQQGGRQGQGINQGNRDAFQRLGQSGANRPGLSQDQKQNFKNSFNQLNQNNVQASRLADNRIRDQFPESRNWFNNDFYARHNYNPAWYRPGVNWWRGTNWATAAAWMGLASAPYAYYYTDDGYPIDFSYDEVNSYALPQQDNYYINQTPNEQYASSIPAAGSGTPQEQQGDWLPLGVFAVGTTTGDASYSNKVIQLALNKNGFIAGTYYNAATDKTYPLEGSVNQENQQAVWKMSNSPDSPVMSTGLYNLTQDAATVRLYFPADGSEQTRALVRLQE